MAFSERKVFRIIGIGLRNKYWINLFTDMRSKRVWIDNSANTLLGKRMSKISITSQFAEHSFKCFEVNLHMLAKLHISVDKDILLFVL